MNNPPIPPPTITTASCGCVIVPTANNASERRSFRLSSPFCKHQAPAPATWLDKKRKREDFDARLAQILIATRAVVRQLSPVLPFSVLGHTPAQAGDYPDRTVKIVVPFPAGGTADAIPRIVADWLSRKWGQPVIIENRTGAAGNIGAEQVYHSPPDGYTLLSAPPPPLVINQNLYPKLGFEPAKFEPIIVMAHVPNALIVNPNNVKATALAELIEYLQKNPDKVTSATQGNGTTSHLTVRTVSTDGQGEAAAHSLSRLGAGAAGPARRRRRPDVRQSWRLAAPGPGRQAEADRGRLIQPSADPAGRADARRDPAGVRGRRLVWRSWRRPGPKASSKRSTPT